MLFGAEKDSSCKCPETRAHNTCLKGNKMSRLSVHLCRRLRDSLEGQMIVFCSMKTFFTLRSSEPGRLWLGLCFKLDYSGYHIQKEVMGPRWEKGGVRPFQNSKGKEAWSLAGSTGGLGVDKRGEA